MNDIEPKYLNHEQAAKYLGISPNTLYIKTSQKAIKVFKMKGSHLNRYKVSDLDNLLEPVK